MDFIFQFTKDLLTTEVSYLGGYETITSGNTGIKKKVIINIKWNHLGQFPTTNTK